MTEDHSPVSSGAKEASAHVTAESGGDVRAQPNTPLSSGVGSVSPLVVVDSEIEALDLTSSQVHSQGRKESFSEISRSYLRLAHVPLPTRVSLARGLHCPGSCAPPLDLG